ncbi:MAG: hypothetical protein QG567_285, partial [Campylobacterota bacterium]|nr:hypothetical protein [Campylobacterota bacterium]
MNISLFAKSYANILFLENKYVGVALIFITFINPSVAISGILALIATVLFAELVDLRSEYLGQGFYLYNSILVGMGVGFLFEPSVLSVVFIAILSSFTFLFSYMLNRLFYIYKIPILSLPFSVVTIFAYLASIKYSGLFVGLVNSKAIYDIHLPLELSALLKSIGTIFFLPNTMAGILILVLILAVSRVVFFMAIASFYFGVAIHSYFLGSFEQALYSAYSFNYILVGVALGGIFLLPSIKNFLLALIGVAISVVLTDSIEILFNYYAIPVFTLPFNFTVITFVFVLSMIYYKGFNYNIKSTPEKSLASYLSSLFRFGINEAKISPPFSGEWSVYQVFNDEWTHKGNYKHAYDFVIEKDNKTYKNQGLYLEDYYCFGESVLAPVNGYIVEFRHDLPDNQIGSVDRINNWGNYIIIKSDFGFYVEISHVMQYSIKLHVGEYVKLNDVVAKCGNSGYSPQPHIHIQVQDTPNLGAHTRGFCFSEYYSKNRIIFNSLPNKNEIIESIIADKSMFSRLNFILDESFKYEVFKDDKIIEEIEFVAVMNTLGEFYFEDSHKNKLYFYTHINLFYFYNYEGGDSYLKYIFKIA